jgi:hypothetical protein
MARIGTQNSIQGNKRIRFGTSGVVTTNNEAIVPHGMPFNIRFVRDGSNNVTFAFGLGAGTVAMHRVLTQAANQDYTFSQAGTLARVELSIHTPTGPAAGQHVCDAYVDAFETV